MTKDEAIKAFGSQAKLAEALGLSRAAVSLWGETVPPLRAYQIREILDRRQAEQTTTNPLAA